MSFNERPPTAVQAHLREMMRLIREGKLRPRQEAEPRTEGRPAYSAPHALTKDRTPPVAK